MWNWKWKLCPYPISPQLVRTKPTGENVSETKENLGYVLTLQGISPLSLSQTAKGAINTAWSENYDVGSLSLSLSLSLSPHSLSLVFSLSLCLCLSFCVSVCLSVSLLYAE